MWGEITKMVLLYIYIFPSDIQHVAFFSDVSLQVFAFRQSFHILWYTRPSWLLSPFCRLSNFLSHYPFCAFYTHVPWPYMIVCSSFLSLTPLISFTSANFPRLTCVFCYNWGSTSLHWQVLLKECVQVSFSAPRQCLSCSALRLTITRFLYSPSFPSILFCLTYFISDTSSFLVFCPRCDFAFSLPSLTSPQGLSCSSLPLNIPPTAHLFYTFPPEKGMKRELPAHFSLLMLSSCPSHGNSTTYSSDLSSLRAPFRLLIRRREWIF